ncbi:Uncharacterised protein [Chlamydia abortus]|nr:Uncharacterised protein [Chlamydia abortus]
MKDLSDWDNTHMMELTNKSGMQDLSEGDNSHMMQLTNKSGMKPLSDWDNSPTCLKKEPLVRKMRNLNQGDNSWKRLSI